MLNLKRLISLLAVFTFLFSLLVGCSKADTELNQTTLAKSTSTPTVTTTNTALPKLESWIGDYTFSEFSSPDQNMFYVISIYKENGNYYAKISIDGFQTIERLQAKVSGDENIIKLLFYKYLPDNLWEPYKAGDILLSFEKRDSNLYTFWGKIQPILNNDIQSGKVYFEIEP